MLIYINVSNKKPQLNSRNKNSEQNHESIQNIKNQSYSPIRAYNWYFIQQFSNLI